MTERDNVGAKAVLTGEHGRIAGGSRDRGAEHIVEHDGVLCEERVDVRRGQLRVAVQGHTVPAQAVDPKE